MRHIMGWDGEMSFLGSARFERLLAAVLLTSTGPATLSQWLSLVSSSPRLYLG